jgi:hypothetical protein
MAFCNMIILINVLDFQTYKFSEEFDIDDLGTLTLERLASIEAFDYNSVSAMDHARYQHSRGLAFALLDWLFKSVDIKDVETGELVERAYEKLWIPYISQQVSAILHYKIKAEQANLKGASGCTSSTLRRQILLCFRNTPLENPVRKAMIEQHTLLTFSNPERYTVSKRASLSAPLGEL